MAPKTRNSRLTFWKIIWNFFTFHSPEHQTLYDLVAQGDTEKEKKLLLNSLKITHIVFFSTIPIAIIVLIFLLPDRGFILHPQNGTLSNGALISLTVMFYIVSMFFTIVAYKWSRISKYIKFVRMLYLMDLFTPDPNQRLYMNVGLSHILRIGLCFEITAGYAFLLRLLGGSWYAVVPLFLLAIIGYILTFPTANKCDKWLIEQRSASPDN
jgi:hypothetical protein